MNGIFLSDMIVEEPCVQVKCGKFWSHLSAVGSTHDALWLNFRRIDLSSSSENGIRPQVFACFVLILLLDVTKVELHNKCWLECLL